MIGRSSSRRLFHAGLATTALLTLIGCASPRAVMPLGPRATEWVGPDRTVKTGWSGNDKADPLRRGRLDERDPLRRAITEALMKKGVTLVESNQTTVFHIMSYILQRDMEWYERHPWISADFMGIRKEYIGDNQRCYVTFGSDDIVSITIKYDWGGDNIDYDVLYNCIDFAFGR